MRLGQISIAVTIVLSGAASARPACTPWADPGRNPNTVAPSLVVLDYKDIAQANLLALSRRMRYLEYTEVVEIRDGTIIGLTSGDRYGNLRDMHYGKGQWCTGPVALPPITTGERGLLYCTGSDCVVDWFICHNVSRLDRLVPPTRLTLVPPPVEKPPEYEGGYIPPVVAPPPGPEGVVSVVPPSYPWMYLIPYLPRGWFFPHQPRPSLPPPDTEVCLRPDQPVYHVPEPGTPLLLGLGALVAFLTTRSRYGRHSN